MAYKFSMKKINFRGPDQKVIICQNYEVKPLDRRLLLNGETIKGDCGTIGREIYRFLLKMRQNSSYWGIYPDSYITQLGSCAGKGLAIAAGYPNLPLARLDKEAPSASFLLHGGVFSPHGAGAGSEIPQLNKELLDCFSLTVYIKGRANFDRALGGLRDHLNERYHVPVPLSLIKAVNTVYGHKWFAGEAPLDVVEILKNNNVPIKKFSFLTIEKILKENGISSNLSNPKGRYLLSPPTVT